MELPDITGAIKGLFVPKRYPCKSNRASSLGYAVPQLGGCLRRGVYERTHWDQKELWPVESLMRFEEGNMQESRVLMDMVKAGLNPVEQQSALEWAEYQITGHVDAILVVDGKAVPVEIKSSAPSIFAGIHSFDDLDKKPWTRAYKIQITLYMLMKNIERGIMIFKDKSSGELKQLNITLDYELGEWAIKAAESINAHIAAGTLPDRIEDRETCKNCSFKTVCLPDIQFGEPLKIEDDPILEERMDRYYTLEDSAKEAKRLWDVCKDRFKASAAGGELNVVCGKYHITGKPDTRGTYRWKVEVV